MAEERNENSKRSFLRSTLGTWGTDLQSTHNTDGAVMGADPATSVVNRYCQSCDVPNVSVVGACNYPQNPTYKPTGTWGAIIYWTADARKTKYLQNPGPLV